MLLPHLGQGVRADGNSERGQALLYEKNAPRNTPDWVPTLRLDVPGSTMDRTSIDFLLVTELATLVWLANQATLELHVPQWRVDPANHEPEVDLVVFDLDPGPPASIVECAQVALLLRDELAAHGLEPVVKTSGSKGIRSARLVRCKIPDDLSVRSTDSRQVRHPIPLVVSVGWDVRKESLHRLGATARPRRQLRPTLCGHKRPSVSTSLSWDGSNPHTL